MPRSGWRAGCDDGMDVTSMGGKKVIPVQGGAGDSPAVSVQANRLPHLRRRHTMPPQFDVNDALRKGRSRIAALAKIVHCQHLPFAGRMENRHFSFFAR